MSAFGTKQTFLIASAMSAFGGKADIDWKCTQSGHWQLEFAAMHNAAHGVVG